MKNKLLFVMLTAALAGFIAGCSPSSVDSSSPGIIITPGTTSSTPSAMLVTAGTTSLGLGIQTSIIAYVVDNIGRPVSNAAVAFSLDNALKGRLSAASAVTDTLGQATVTFTAGSSPTTVVITAAIGSVNDSESIAIGGGTGGTVTVAASQANISTSATTTITATVRDSNSNLIANSQITFSLSSNIATLSATSATTNSSGVATVVLTGNSAGTITATAVSTSYGSGNTSVTITAAATNSLTITATSSSILTNATTTISALLSGPAFAAPANGHVVDFSVSNPTIGSLSAVSATTTNGIARVVLNSTALAGTVTVTATYTGTTSLTNSTSITVTAPPPDNVTVSANPLSITVYGTATISAIVTANSYSVPDGTSVKFIVSDSTYGNLSASTVSTVNGKATTTFTASNKSGTVLITAVAGSVSNNASLPITPASTGSIQFVSAMPQLLNLKTAGTDPISTITFAVKDMNGNPATEGTQIVFNMNGPGGGEYIGSVISSTTYTASTVNGSASVILHSGAVAGPVTIIASTLVGSETISTSATQVSIGGGVPSARHWNLATSKFNLAGLKTSGLEASISVYIGDRFGNYNIAENTTISFYTEGGAINTQGKTDATGKTSVTLRTQYPIPSDVKELPGEAWYLGNASVTTHPTVTYNPRDGWVTVLATTQGEEAFLDENGDGLFGAPTGTTSPCPSGYTCECKNAAGSYINSVTTGSTCGAGNQRSEAFLDLSEPFYDKNDDGCRNDGANKNCGGEIGASSDPFEEFINTNPSVNFTFDAPNGKWDGPDCKTSGCQTSKMIWKDIRVVFTGDYYFWPMPDGNDCYSIGGGCTASYDSGSFAEAPASITKGSYGSFTAIIADQFLNSLPGGTVISVTASEGTVTPASVTLLDGLSSGPTWFSFTVDVPEKSEKSVTTVSVSVAGGPPALLSVPLIDPLTITTTTLAGGQVGVAYSQSLVAGGGTAPYTWSVASGGLPSGLSLNAGTGAITGTPTASGTFNFTVQTTDADFSTASQPFSIAINP